MTYQSEDELEEQLVLQLEGQDYERVKIDDEYALKKNFREQLNKFNDKKLKGIPLTDKEFNRIIIYLEEKRLIYGDESFLQNLLYIYLW